jgi:hypothetical protein
MVGHRAMHAVGRLHWVAFVRGAAPGWVGVKEEDIRTLNRFLGEYHPKGEDGHWRRGDPTAALRIQKFVDDLIYLNHQQSMIHSIRTARDCARAYYRRAATLYRSAKCLSFVSGGVFILSCVVAWYR